MRTIKSLGLETIFITSANRYITSQEFNFYDVLKNKSRLWDYFSYKLLENNGINVIYESDYLSTNHYSEKLWYATKNPYSLDYIRTIAIKIFNTINSIICLGVLN